MYIPAVTEVACKYTVSFLNIKRRFILKTIVEFSLAVYFNWSNCTMKSIEQKNLYIHVNLKHNTVPLTCVDRC